MMAQAATALAAIAATLPVGEGWWQTRTLVQGGSSATLELRCISPRGDWQRAILPLAATAECGALARDRFGTVACARGGRLSVSGTAGSDRFDIVARRTGPVGVHPSAVVVLHVEGRLIAQTCPIAAR